MPIWEKTNAAELSGAVEFAFERERAPRCVVPDARGDERVKNLGVIREAGIGACVGVPLRFSDGRLYGMLCALGRSPEPSLERRDTRFMRALGRLVAEQLEREELGEKNLRLAAIEARPSSCVASPLQGTPPQRRRSCADPLSRSCGVFEAGEQAACYWRPGR